MGVWTRSPWVDVLRARRPGPVLFVASEVGGKQGDQRWDGSPPLEPGGSGGYTPDMMPRPPLGQLVLAAALVLGLGGCDDSDCAFDDVDVAGRDVNPEGVPYPAGPYGGTARQGSIPGDVFPNFTFQGYPNSSRGEGLQPISLADFHDPDARRHSVLHLAAVAMWCPYCQAETQEMVQAVPALRAEGAEFIQVIIDGPSQGEPPDRCLLDEWVSEFDTNFSVVLDVDARRLGTIATIRSVPYNVVLDTRTMEVLYAGAGVPSDYTAFVRTYLAWVEGHPR